MPNTQTPNLLLLKPDPADIVDITIINGNMDKLDSFIGNAQLIPIKNSGSFAGAYPQGISMFPLLASDIAADSGWAVGYTATTAEVLNIKSGTDRMTQYWFRSSPLNAEGWYRHLTSTGFTPWRALSDQDYCAQNSTASIALVDGVWTKLAFTATENTSGYAITANAQGGFTINTKGIYQVDAIGNFTSGITTLAMMGFGQFGDAGPSIFNRVTDNPGGSGVLLNGSWTKQFSAGETCFMFAQQQGGGLNKSIADRRMTIKRISWA